MVYGDDNDPILYLAGLPLIQQWPTPAYFSDYNDYIVESSDKRAVIPAVFIAQ